MTVRPLKPDATNRRILAALQLNATMTNQELADAVNLSASACHSRVKALEEAGVIGRYITEINVDRLAPTIRAFIEVTLESHRPDDFRRFDAYVKQQPEFIWSYMISGAADYLLLAMVSNMPSLRSLTERLLEADLAVAKLNTTPVIEQTKSFAGLPLQVMLTATGLNE